MKISTVFILLIFGGFNFVCAQNPENLIPSESVIAFSIDNTSLLDKISLDDLIKYDFMEEVQSELFNGSTKGKNLKDSGIDFNKRISLFSGKNKRFELSGVTFGVTSKDSILKVFDNFDEITSHFQGVNIYRNEFNYMFIKGNSVLIMRVEPEQILVQRVTDSIWTKKGYDYFYYPADNNFNSDLDGYDGNNDPANTGDSLTDLDQTENDAIDSLPQNANPDDHYEQLYWDMRDSVNFEFQQAFIREISTELFVDNNTLVSKYEGFSNQLSKPVDAVFYFDNERNITNSRGVWQFQNIFNSLFSDASELYKGNVLTGELNLVGNSIEASFRAIYNDKLGKIYSGLTKTKFVKDFGKYIYKDALGYFTYNVNLKDCFHTSFDVIMNLLAEETDQKILSNVFLAEVLNEFVDVDNIFDVYQGSMFGSVNGYKTIETTYYDYQYDENTFEYSEKEMKKSQDIPNITLGFKTEKPEFVNKIARLLSKTRQDVINHGTYYEIKDAVLHTIPCYFAVVNDLVLFSVDENLFTTHLNGYAKSERVKIGKAKKSKFTYLYFDIDKTLQKVPRETLTDRQNEIVSSILNKSGKVELRSLGSKKDSAEFKLNYSFENDSADGGKHLLDLINSLYLLTKD